MLHARPGEERSACTLTLGFVDREIQGAERGIAADGFGAAAALT
jgi:hypothetical protein